MGYPNHIASSLDIMLNAPLGSAAFNNEFGRPCLTGYFRTLLTKLPLGDGKEELRGYHKPIMLAGGIGSVRPQVSEMFLIWLETEPYFSMPSRIRSS